MINYYSILQVAETATQEEIRQAYRKLARLFHPDNFNGSKEEAAEHMVKINEAYSVLSDKKKREKYDRERGIEYRKSKSEMYEDIEEEIDDTDIDIMNTTSRNTDISSTAEGGCSSCLAKLIEWAIYIGIICFIISHFNLDDKLFCLLDKVGILQFIGIEYSKEDLESYDVTIYLDYEYVLLTSNTPMNVCIDNEVIAYHQEAGTQELYEVTLTEGTHEICLKNDGIYSTKTIEFEVFEESQSFDFGAKTSLVAGVDFWREGQVK